MIPSSLWTYFGLVLRSLRPVIKFSLLEKIFDISSLFLSCLSWFRIFHMLDGSRKSVDDFLELGLLVVFLPVLTLLLSLFPLMCKRALLWYPLSLSCHFLGRLSFEPKRLLRLDLMLWAIMMIFWLDALLHFFRGWLVQCISSMLPSLVSQDPVSQELKEKYCMDSIKRILY